jgi:zinc protease
MLPFCNTRGTCHNLRSKTSIIAVLRIPNSRLSLVETTKGGFVRYLLQGLAVAAIVIVAPLAPMAAAQQTKAAPVRQLVEQVQLPYQSFTLENGLRVIVHEDRKAPVVAIAAWYNVGSKDEPEGKTGFAHLFEHIGLFNGTENFPSGLMEPLRAMGATDWNGTTWFDRTNYFQTVPTAALEQALYMESDRMGHLLGALTQERLDNQRGVVQNEKRQGDNQPFGLVGYRQLEALFPEGHPYRHSTIGSMADLDSASLDDLRRWFREKYGPNNAVLVLAGDIDAATARALVQRYFGHIPRGPDNVPAAADVPTLSAPISDRMTDRVANSRLYRNWAVPGLLDPASVPLAVAADIIGGLASSRLDNELVRKEQTAVSVSSSMQPFHRVGLFTVTADVKPGVDSEAVAARLDAIIADFIAKGPTQDEVQRSVVRNLSSRIRGLEQVGGFGGKAVALAEGELYAGDPAFHLKQLQAYARLTPADVRAAAQRWLSRPVYALRVDPGEREAYQEAAASPSGAQAPASAEPLRTIPRGPMPAVGQVANLDFPEIERATLSNGIPITYARRQTVPVTRVAFEFDAGHAADPEDKLGLQLLTMNLLRQGTTSRNSIQIAEEQERLGAIIGSGGSMDRSDVVLTALTPNLASSLDLLADIVRNPAFAPGEVDRLKNQHIAGIASELTQPAAIARRVLPRSLYGAHPYGRPFSGMGEQAALRQLSREDLVGFQQTWLRPDNAHIFVVGDVPLAQIVPLLEARFGNWRAPAPPKGVKTFTTATPTASPRILLVDRPQSPQSFILAGSVLPLRGTDNVLHLQAANEVLGGDFLARINQDLRETRGWSYGVWGFLQMMEEQIPYLVQAPVQSNQTGPSVAAILDHIRAFTTDKGVTSAELQRVVGGNTRQLAGMFETSGAVLGALRSNALYRRPDNYWETVADRYRRMTPATLDQAARGALDPSRFTIVVVGDASVVRPQLEALNISVEEVKPQ